MHQSPHAPAVISSSTRHVNRRLFDQGVAPSMRRDVRRRGQRQADRLREGLQQQCAASCASSSRCSRGPGGGRVDDPALRPSQAARACCELQAAQANRALRPATRFGAEVERPVEREHAGPARRHAHVRDVAEGPAVRTEQRRGLRGRDRHRDRAEHLVLPTRNRSAIPSRAGRAGVRARRRRLDLEVARERAHQRAHAGRADPPFVDRCRPGRSSSMTRGSPGVQHPGPRCAPARSPRTPAAGGDELRAVVEGQIAVASRGSRPPRPRDRSKTVTFASARSSSCAHARPAMPAPMTAILTSTWRSLGPVADGSVRPTTRSV